MAQHKEGSYTLLDVRQPKEYEQRRLPGAKNIPVSELVDRLEELPKQKPVLVYCAVGGRSRTAAQLLSGQGFSEVYNMKGGLAAWQGHTSETDPEIGMPLMAGDESPTDMILLAYGMEAGLEKFYDRLAAYVIDEELAALLRKLATIEDSHKKKLFSLYKGFDEKISDKEDFKKNWVAGLMEGGMTVEAFMETHQATLSKPFHVLNMAMMIETQALDLYLRYSHKADNKETKEVLYEIAQDEKAHLAALGALMDNVSAQQHVIDKKV